MFGIVSYIVGNPLRAGLCETLAEYPFIGSSRYSLEEITTSVQSRPEPLG